MCLRSPSFNCISTARRIWCATDSCTAQRPLKPENIIGKTMQMLKIVYENSIIKEENDSDCAVCVCARVDIRASDSNLEHLVRPVDAGRWNNDGTAMSTTMLIIIIRRRKICIVYRKWAKWNENAITSHHRIVSRSNLFSNAKIWHIGIW